MRQRKAFGSHEINMGADYTEEEVEFIREMDRFMREKRRRFPTFVEVLRVAKSLGYRRNPTEKTSLII
jgi:hypothetical protein